MTKMPSRHPFQPMRMLLLLALLLTLQYQVTISWVSTRNFRLYQTPRSASMSRLLDASSSSSSTHDQLGQSTEKGAEPSSTSSSNQKGDSVRASSGVRPSLHPIAINILTQLLMKRYNADDGEQAGAADASSSSAAAAATANETNNTTDTNTPLQYALDAATLASAALAQRTAHDDNDHHLQLTLQEQQTIAGRVVNISVRLAQLESMLYDKCQRHARRLTRYNEWSSLGVLSDESSNRDAICRQLNDNPLFALNRAECLLAVFLVHVEAPELKQKNATVPGGSVVDFIDHDRMEILFDDTSAAA